MAALVRLVAVQPARDDERSGRDAAFVDAFDPDVTPGIEWSAANVTMMPLPATMNSSGAIWTIRPPPRGQTGSWRAGDAHSNV